MTLYRNITTVDANQWFKNGDHPEDHIGDQVVDWGKVGELRPDLLESSEAISTDDIPPEAYYTRIEGAVVRYFRRPEKEFSGKGIHDLCGKFWHNHGWIDSGGDGQPVCPGDWVIRNIMQEYEVVHSDLFSASYERIDFNEARIGLSVSVDVDGELCPKCYKPLDTPGCTLDAVQPYHPVDYIDDSGD